MFLTRKPQNPTNNKSNQFDQVIAALDDHIRATDPFGLSITARSAMRQSTVWACARLISEIIASLPLEIQERNSAGRWKLVPDHDALETISNPNTFQTQHEFISFLVLWSELAGNAYYYKQKVGGMVKYFPIPADQCNMDLRSRWKIEYQVSNEYVYGTMDSNAIFHLRNFSINGWEGLSTIGQHRQSVGLALQLQEHANAAYQNGLHTNKWMTVPSLPKKGSQEEKDLEEALAKIRGALNSGKMPVISKGQEFKEFTSMSAVDAQYIESRKMEKQEIASIFLIPLFLLNDTEKSTTWGSGLEQITRSFIRFSINPRLNRVKETFLREFIAPAKQKRTRFIFDTDQFTLGDFKDRMDGYLKAIMAGLYNADECREFEGRNPREDGMGGLYRTPSNMQIDDDKIIEDNLVTNGGNNEPEDAN